MNPWVQDQPGHGETPSLLKKQKLARCGGMRLWSQLLGRLRRKNRLNPGGGCSKPKLRHCTPAWQQSKTLSQKIKIKLKNASARKKKKEEKGRVWWLTPIIQALWRPRQADHLKSGVQDQPDQHGETPSLFKKKKMQVQHLLMNIKLLINKP